MGNKRELKKIAKALHIYELRISSTDFAKTKNKLHFIKSVIIPRPRPIPDLMGVIVLNGEEPFLIVVDVIGLNFLAFTFEDGWKQKFNKIYS